MFSEVSKIATERLAEVRNLLSHIKTLESTPPEPDREETHILRGLFYVHLYGAFEFSVTSAVQTLLQHITEIEVEHRHFEHTFSTISLDGRFSALYNTSSEKKWTARKELLIGQKSTDKCRINDTLFHKDLQNLWHNTLENVFQCLCISGDVLPDISIRGYIDEVVGKRNAVAHGRESPATVGRTRSAELETRLNAINQTVTHVIVSFSAHLKNMTFVDDKYRNKYIVLD